MSPRWRRQQCPCHQASRHNDRSIVRQILGPISQAVIRNIVTWPEHCPQQQHHRLHSGQCRHPIGNHWIHFTLNEWNVSTALNEMFPVLRHQHQNSLPWKLPFAGRMSFVCGWAIWARSIWSTFQHNEVHLLGKIWILYIYRHDLTNLNLWYIHILQ